MSINSLVFDGALLLGAGLITGTALTGVGRAPALTLVRAARGLYAASLVFAALQAMSLTGLASVPAGPESLLPGIMVLVIAGSVLMFSSRHLDGNPQLGAFARSAVLLVVSLAIVALSQTMLLFAAAWLVSTQAVLRLLKLDPSKRAFSAASRTLWPADLAIVLALAALWIGSGELLPPVLPIEAEAAAALHPMVGWALLTAVLLRSAIVPVHWWLIRAMAAPTPVSAFLHAGFINGGGLLCLKFWPLFAATPALSSALMVFAAISVVLAAGAMRARRDVKGHLAVSTVLQMSFMLLQVALGAPVHALLHLLAHAPYKAHALLTSGSNMHPLSVTDNRTTPNPTHLWATAGVMLVAVAALVVGWPPADVLLAASLGVMFSEGLVNATTEKDAAMLRTVLTQALVAVAVVWGGGAWLDGVMPLEGALALETGPNLLAMGCAIGVLVALAAISAAPRHALGVWPRVLAFPDSAVWAGFTRPASAQEAGIRAAKRP